jgi:hypothetical protein
VKYRSLRLCIVGLLVSAPSMASAFGVTLNASGSAGDACQAQPQIGEEAFNSGSLSAGNSLIYSGSAVGFDNGWPGPVNSGLSGCVFSPIFANIGASGTAAFGSLQASVSAEMGSVGLVGANAGIGESFFDTITSISGGTYVITFQLDPRDDGSPICGGPSTRVRAGAVITGAFEFQQKAEWDYSNCADPGPFQLYGGAVAIDNGSGARMSITLGAGGTFGISGSLQLNAGAGVNQSSSVDEGDPAIMTIAGVNGATYFSASGTNYSAPEPALWLGAACCLAALAFLRGRRRGGARSDLY